MIVAKIGEIIQTKYKVLALLGRGVFSNVFRVLDVTDGSLLALKIMRKNELMYDIYSLQL